MQFNRFIYPFGAVEDETATKMQKREYVIYYMDIYQVSIILQPNKHSCLQRDCW